MWTGSRGTVQGHTIRTRPNPGNRKTGLEALQTQPPESYENLTNTANRGVCSPASPECCRNPLDSQTFLEIFLLFSFFFVLLVTIWHSHTPKPSKIATNVRLCFYELMKALLKNLTPKHFCHRLNNNNFHIRNILSHE